MKWGLKKVLKKTNISTVYQQWLGYHFPIPNTYLILDVI